MSKETIAAFH